MLPSGAGVTVEKPNRIYFCNECRTVFLFKLDASDHEKMTGHAHTREMAFEGNVS